MSSVVNAAPRGTVALVESATQLLNVIEWAHARESLGVVRVLVLASAHQATGRQLAHVGRLAHDAGLEVETVQVRRRSGSAVADAARLVRDVARADQVVLGDPFSGLIQMALSFARPDRIVVVDDGTATWEFRDCIDTGRPLLRWRTERTRSTRATHATRLLTPGAARELTVFSCLRDARPVGAFGETNRYAWTRSRSVPDVRPGVDLVGASLVETGVVKRAEYVAAIAAVAQAHGRVRYFAHRRESAAGLAAVATVGGIDIVHPDVPVELALRAGPVAERVITFPSTAAHTLPVVLADLPVQLEIRRIEAAWFTPASTPRVRRFVGRIADDAPETVRHVA